METENDVKDIPETKENEEPTRLLSVVKKEKNPKRVAGGKKGVEARKMKAELKRKEAELLKKENIELKERKQITRGEAPPVFKDDEDYALRTNKRKEDSPSNKDYKLLLCLSIGIGGLGLYIYNQRKQSQASEASSTLRTPSKQVVPIPENPTQKKEIDPFEF